MMKIRNNGADKNVKNLNLDMLVLQYHIIRKINSVFDLSFIYELTLIIKRLEIF